MEIIEGQRELTKLTDTLNRFAVFKYVVRIFNYFVWLLAGRTNNLHFSSIFVSFNEKVLNKMLEKINKIKLNGHFSNKCNKCPIVLNKILNEVFSKYNYI